MEDASTQDKHIMTGKKALVQTGTGLFYGTLEKADTRYGTALLSDAWEIPMKYAIDEISARWLIGECIASKRIIDITARISQSGFTRYVKERSLTDLASAGIVLATMTGNDEPHSKIPLLSLAGVVAVAPLADKKVQQSFEHPYRTGEIALYRDYRITIEPNDKIPVA